MPTIDNDSLVQQVPHSGEYGNMSVWSKSFTKAGVLNGDLLRIQRLPAGARVDEMKLVFDDAGTAATLSLGYAPVNPDDGPSAVANYWGAAIDVSAAAGVFRSAAHPITFDFDVYVTATVAGANFTGSPKLTSVASGEATGTK
jgi:hypothetical protein